MVITILDKERLSESREKIYGKLVEDDERPMILGSLFLLAIVISRKRGFRFNRMLLFSLKATFRYFMHPYEH